MPSLRQHRLKRSYVNAKIQRFAKLYLEMRYVLRLRCNSQGFYYELRPGGGVTHHHKVVRMICWENFQPPGSRDFLALKRHRHLGTFLQNRIGI